MNRKYIVQLSDEERAQLQQMIASGTASARKIRRAQILLKSDRSPKGPTGGIRLSVRPLMFRKRPSPRCARPLVKAAWKLR